MSGPGSDSGPQFDDEMQDEYDLNPSAAQAPPGEPATPQREAVGVVSPLGQPGSTPTCDFYSASLTRTLGASRQGRPACMT